MADCDRQTMRSCYEVLEIKPSASLEEVKEAYRDLAFVWHPDRYVSNPRLQKKAQDRFQAINHAYHLLECCLTHGQGHQHHNCHQQGADPRSPVAQAYRATSNAQSHHSHASHTHAKHNTHHQTHHHTHQATQQTTQPQQHGGSVNAGNRHAGTGQHHSTQAQTSYAQSHGHDADNHTDHGHHGQAQHHSHQSQSQQHSQHSDHHPDPNHQGYSYSHHAADRERERRINMKPPPQVEINPWLLLCVVCLSGVLTNMTIVIAHSAPFLELVLPQPTFHQR